MNSDDQYSYEVQDALQQRQLDANQTLYAPQLQESVQQTQAILVEQTNPKKVVKSIILRLRGKEEDGQGNLVDVAEPKMNKEGIENFWFILDSHINQNIIFSHLDDPEIRAIMDTLQEDLVDDLSLNWRRYGIKKRTDLDVINNAVLTNIFLALKRAREQNEKNWLGKISVENISNASIPRPRKEGWLSKFKI